MDKQYEVTFTNVEGKKIKMKLWLSPEIAEMKLHPMKELKNGKTSN